MDWGITDHFFGFTVFIIVHLIIHQILLLVLILFIVVVAAWLTFIYDLLNLLISFVSLAHHSFLRHFKGVLILFLIAVVIFVVFLPIG